MSLEEILKNQNTKVIDVRNPDEFQEGHVAGSLNIPLGEVSFRVEEFKQMEGPLVLCCRSGNRSGMAVTMLNQYGVECVNGGSWTDVNAAIANNQ